MEGTWSLSMWAGYFFLPFAPCGDFGYGSYLFGQKSFEFVLSATILFLFLFLLHLAQWLANNRH